MKQSFNEQLISICQQKNNRLCIGLDINPDDLPRKIGSNLDDLEKFSRGIIDATIEFCPVYKLNMAFYERFGSKGYAWLERTVAYINGRAITIADGKRGDIGNSARQYARAVFLSTGFDSVTLSPYMGRDSIQPFLEDATKGAFILCLTSNPSAADLQYYQIDDIPIYQKVGMLARELNQKNNVGLVVGGTKTNEMINISDISTGLPWLIPGVGTQGGDLKSAINFSERKGIGIINVSRGIITAGNGDLAAVYQAAYSFTTQIRALI